MASFSAQFLTLCLVAFVSSQYHPAARLYSSTNCGGTSVTLPSGNSYTPDLASLGFDNRAMSVMLRGTWMFYDSANFNNAGNALMEYIFKPSETCVNFFDIGGYVTSVKFAGQSADYRLDSITFYAFTYFQAHEEYVQNDLPNSNLYGRTSSFIITGSSPWTLYDGANYGGQAICVQVAPSPNYEPAFVADTVTLDPTVPHGSIASVRKGCYSKNVDTLKRGHEQVHEKSIFVNPTF